jgi:hypothetical protein
MFFIDFPCDKFYIIVESEDAGDEQEGLGEFFLCTTVLDLWSLAKAQEVKK